jgi:hypothetical protein
LARTQHRMFWLPVVLAAYAPFLNFAAVNAGEGVSLWIALKYATSVAALGVIPILGLIPLGRVAMSRSALAVSLFIFIFFSFSAVRHITGTDGPAFYATYIALLFVGCLTACLLSENDLVRRSWLVMLLFMCVASTLNYSIHTMRLEDVAQSEKQAVADRARTLIAKSITLDYSATGTISSVLPASSTATPHDGAAFLGYDFSPKNTRSVLRVRVIANAFARENNLAVLALFRTDQQAPLALESKEVPANGYAVFDVSVDVPVNDGATVGLTVRAGPGKSGTIIINGPEVAAKPNDVPAPKLTIEERVNVSVDAAIKTPRNVYYLTLDGYIRADVLRESFDFDNSDFMNFLRSNGFLVSRNSTVNYPLTYLSVSSALEQSFTALETDGNVWAKMPWFLEKIEGKNRVFRRFQEFGYFVAKLTFQDECLRGAYVDFCYDNNNQKERMDLRLTELDANLLQLTPLYDLLTKYFSVYFHSYLNVKDMDDVIRMAKYLDAPQPKFFYNHIFLPHPPYRFAADCSPSKAIKDAETILGAKALFLDQTRCANKKIEEFVRYVVKNDPDAIVLINSDHGWFSTNWTLSYEKWPASALQERFSNLNAMRLPDSCKRYFYDTISPINYFELVFSCLQEREPHFLEDRMYITPFDPADKHYGQLLRYR